MGEEATICRLCGRRIAGHVARFVADEEALYSYEGTREIGTPIAGRAITGFSAFV